MLCSCGRKRAAYLTSNFFNVLHLWKAAVRLQTQGFVGYTHVNMPCNGTIISWCGNRCHYLKTHITCGCPSFLCSEDWFLSRLKVVSVQELKFWLERELKVVIRMNGRIDREWPGPWLSNYSNSNTTNQYKETIAERQYLQKGQLLRSHVLPSGNRVESG